MVGAFVVALVLAIVLRRGAIIGFALGALLFTPLEQAFPLRRQRVFRSGLLTDLTHVFLTGLIVAVGTVVVVVTTAIALFPVRRLDVEAALPGWAAVVLAVMVTLLGSYWGHRLTHRVPQLWRFHSVHHSIEHMDWIAAARLHPVDAVFTQGVAAVPLVALGYDQGAFAGVAAFVTALAVFQHANVRFRFPGIRWILPTPEWHHWHHALDSDASDINFGLPIIDKVFGTAFLPRERRPGGFGVLEPVPDDYVGQLTYPFGST